MLKYSSFISYIFIVGAAQGFLLSFFLFKKKENITANRLLGVIMICFAIDLLNGVSYLTGFIRNMTWAIGISNTFPYLYGPGIYLYVKILREGDNYFRKGYLLHLIPFLITQVYGLLFFYFEDPSYHLNLIDFSKQQPWHILLVGNLIPLSGVVYLILTVKESLKYNYKLKQSFSNIDKINLAWLRHLVYGNAVVWLVVFIAYTITYFIGTEFQANILIYIFIAVLLYSLGIKALNQPQVMFLDTGNEVEEKSYKKSGLDESTAEIFLKTILQIMNDKKPYLNNKLNLGDLSELTGISTHNLSEIINTKLNKNFYDFINSYRIDEVKRMLLDKNYNNVSLLGIGFEAGFSSKTAFYNTFKKFTGLTPSQYKNEKNKKAA